jgi:hypothetical protein
MPDMDARLQAEIADEIYQQLKATYVVTLGSTKATAKRSYGGSNAALGTPWRAARKSWAWSMRRSATC